MSVVLEEIKDIQYITNNSGEKTAIIIPLEGKNEEFRRLLTKFIESLSFNDVDTLIKLVKSFQTLTALVHSRKPYESLPAFCKGFDVALNPFEINELTLAANPLKVREYLAAGLQVVSTDIPEVRILEHCLIGGNHADFIEKVEYALKNPKPRREISDSIKTESWESKIEELRGILAGI
jgi:glycosyltransferase involved in cell wall biosynthesis